MARKLSALRSAAVAGLGAVIAYAGMVPLTTLSANAAAGSGPFTATNATSVSLSASDTAALGACNAFTVTIPAGDTVSVNIQQTVPASPAPATTTIGFCDPTATGEGTSATPVVNGPGPNGGTENATGSSCNQGTASGSPTTATCNTTFSDTVPAGGDGKITFGVDSNATGTMTVNAFADSNAPPNGAQDLAPAEPGATVTKTWVQDNTTTPAASSNTVSCLPASAANTTNATHAFTCTAKDANGVLLPNQQVNFAVTDGPDAGTGYTTPGGAAHTTTTTRGTPGGFDSFAACSTTADGTAGSTLGQATCSYVNNSQPGHDVINVWLESNNTIQQQSGEPVTQITKDWVQAAANGSLVTVTCTPNQAAHFTVVKPNNSSVCENPLKTTSVTLKALVVNGTPAAPQAGVLVNWRIAVNTDGTDKDSAISAASCITGTDGTCSVMVTNPSPIQDQFITVQAAITRQDTTGDVADGVFESHNPVANEARNITVKPSVTTQPSGGVQTLTAMVTDRFMNAVAGVALDWAESGPGAFRSGANTGHCNTDSTGTCSLDVASLSTESGDETVTVTIDDGNYIDGAPKNECSSPAGFTNFNDGVPVTDPGHYNNAGTTPNANGQNNVFAPAVVGICSTTAKVTWQTAQQNGSLQITSFTNSNPAACSAFTISGTAPSGATVTLTGFNFRQGTFSIGTATADSSGHWSLTGSGVCFNTTVTASTGSGAGATNSNTVTLGFHQVFTNVHFTRVGPYRNGLIEYNVSGSSTSIVGGEPIRVQNSSCRSGLCGITHMRSSGFTNLHIYLKPGTYSLTVYGTGGSDPAFGGDGHQYLNGFSQPFTVTIS